jgi:DNA-binding NtrC family response regulator
VLQEQEFEPLGSNRVQRVDVRIVAATSRDLGAMVAAGQFRADLFYRLNVLPIRVPPLRERLEDLDALVDTLAEDIARRSGLPHKSLTPDALDLLAAQPWPGNIRELRNVLEQATLMTDDAALEPAHFASALRLAPAAATPVPAVARPAPAAVAPPLAEAALAPLLRPLQQQVDELECAALTAALTATGGNRLATARLLKMSRAALYDKLARHPQLAHIGR